MQTTLIRRFTTSDQLTHFLNATAWEDVMNFVS